MESKNIILDRASLVLIGNFNPSIFSPAWFALNKLVSEPEADAARVTLIHPEMCQFEIGHFTIQSDLQHFMVAGPWQYREMLRDLIVDTFGKYLRHTPIRGIGINRELHFDSTHFKIRNAIGEYFAPKRPWGDWGEILERVEHSPELSQGLVSLVMKEMLNDDFRGHVQANIQPSHLPALSQKGIFMAINCHFELPNTPNSPGVDMLMAALEQRWSFSEERSSTITKHIQSLAEQYRREMGIS